ncbi:MAG: hypothetical protein IJV76_00825 [Clostridia bacterium]|nr:hypothetical protein [Clostridia bacterium]
MKFQGDLLLTDPMYIIKKDSGYDWNLLLSEGYDHAALHLLGIRNYLSAEFGEDTVRNVVNSNGVRIGSFCSDSSLFCVCDLKQVLAYNPDFLIMNNGYPDSFCVVRDFDGEIFLKTDTDSQQNIIAVGVNGFRTVSCSKGKSL